MFSCILKELFSHFHVQKFSFGVKVPAWILAISELSKRPGNSDVEDASRDCFW